MEGLLKTHNSSYLFLSLLILLSSFVFHSESLSPEGTIERITKQQLLANLPPFSHETIPAGSSQLFLTSPSGKYSVYLLRRETSIGAGGFGSDFCYLQVQQSGVSVWESDCTPVSNANTCSLVFGDSGLEIFDGSNSAWDNDVDGENLETLVLMDSGDMQIRDKYGDMVWRASDNPLANQNCGSLGAPGMAPGLPPFAAPIHGGRGPFGQSTEHTVDAVVNQLPQVGIPAADEQPKLAPQPEDQFQPEHEPQQKGAYSDHKQEGLNQPFSSFGGGDGTVANHQQESLLDNIPFDSGYSMIREFKIWVTLVPLLLTFMAFFE